MYVVWNCLSYAKKITEAHGGKFLSRRSWNGSEFELILPSENKQ